MNKFLISALFLSTSALVHSAEWVYVTSGSDSTINVDTSSVVSLKNGDRKVWIEFIYNTPQSANNGVKYGRALQLGFYRCSERTAAISQQLLYGADGNGAVVGNITIPKNSLSYIDVAPDSINDGIINFVCSLKIGKK